MFGYRTKKKDCVLPEVTIGKVRLTQKQAEVLCVVLVTSEKITKNAPVDTEGPVWSEELRTLLKIFNFGT